METAVEDLDARLAARLHELRASRGLSLDALAERAGVSRSMISLIERGQSSPTAATLHRLAAGLGVTMHELFAQPTQREAAPLARRADQTVWRDPDSGYTRRQLSPAGYPSPLRMIEVVLPAGARVAYDNLAVTPAPLKQQLWLIEGALEVAWGRRSVSLAKGDCLAMDAPATAFHNPHDKPARYLIAATSAA